MNKKVCSICKEEKEVSEFYKKSDRKGPASSCKSCFNRYCNDRSRQKKIDAIIFKGSECQDCGVKYPDLPYVVFDFHHIDPTKKDFDWSKMRLVSKEKMHKELDKCCLLCSNCHRIRHHNILVVPPRIELGTNL